MRKVRLLLCLGLVALSPMLTGSALAQQQEARVALVVGNANYPDAGTALPNAINDATALAEEFRRVHFSVDVKKNLRKEEMQQAIDAFAAKIKKGTIALFYFSGFGLQVARQTYLLPINAQIWTEADVRRDGISADALLAEMRHKGASVKIVVIDAARRNPFERRFRTVPAGLAPLNAPVDTLVLYSGALNKLIDEKSSGGHSLFAAELIKELRVRNLSAEEIFNRARIGVSRASGGRQVPWVASSLLADFYFGARPPGTSPPAASDTSSPPASPVASVPPESPPVASRPPPPKPAAPPQKQTASLPPPVDDCDRLAANAYDRGRTTAGVAFEDLDSARAIAACKSAVAAYPGTPRFHYELGRAWHKAGGYSEALAEYRKAASKDYAAAISNIGLMYLNGQGVAKDYDHAIADFSEAIRLDPKSATAYSNRGIVYAYKKNYDRAIADYTEAIRLDPDLTMVHNNRGNVYRIKGDYDTAIADFGKAIRLEPKNAMAYYNRGLVYAAKKNYDRAIADYTEAIRINPKYAIAYNDRGIAYNNKRDYDRAIADYTEAIRIDPKFVYPYNNRGNAYKSKRNYNRAFADYAKAIEVNPKYAMAYYNRASAFMDQKKYHSAISDCDEAIRFNPDFPLAYVERGRSYRVLGQNERAIADYNEAIRRDGKLAVAYSDRGFSYKALGRKSDAIADFRKALALNPSDEPAKQALQQLTRPSGEIPKGAMGPVRTGFAAIAYSAKTKSWGEAYGYNSRKGAERRAVSECGGSEQGCKVAVWYRRYCGGVASATNGAWAGGTGSTKKVAALEALKACTKNGGADCQLVRLGCTR